ncbi:hypothetical protein ELZ15_01360 [Brucella melitensis]|nr:ABC transporter, permease protein [Brucella suis bv. 2]AUS48616.1 hypothetical protein C0R52_15030 [Brucella melitensis]ENT69322.1 hypothetical protein D628_03188 [Brucella melitensis F15/06-7]QOK69018.1 hypothetical protein HUZ31_15630 [Brucella suis bv. 5]AIB22599.1 ABC transporter, permease protein [Brucella suis bv. 2]
MDLTQAILLTIATAATPLLIAAIGELVVERSGVLNLGVEGMMLMGAVSGFAVAQITGSALLPPFWSGRCLRQSSAFLRSPSSPIRWRPALHSLFWASAYRHCLEKASSGFRACG